MWFMLTSELLDLICELTFNSDYISVKMSPLAMRHGRQSYFEAQRLENQKFNPEDVKQVQ